MTKPILYVFAISHYCEKARWALDYLGIDYTLKHLPPGAHAQFAKKIGAPGSSLPILLLKGSATDKVIQGSADIISWAEENKAASATSLSLQANEAEGLKIEQRLDDVLGVHVRRYYYSEALVEYPATVRTIFTKDLPFIQKWSITFMWSTVRKFMIKGMDLGPEQGQQSRQRLLTELKWLDELLGDGRSFLAGDKLTRTDITAASLLGPLVRPKEHHLYTSIELPPNVVADCEQWKGRPCLRWTSQIYQDHRCNPK